MKNIPLLESDGKVQRNRNEIKENTEESVE